MPAFIGQDITFFVAGRHVTERSIHDAWTDAWRACEQAWSSHDFLTRIAAWHAFAQIDLKHSIYCSQCFPSPEPR